MSFAQSLPEEILSSIFLLASHIDTTHRELDDFSVDNDTLISTWPKSQPAPQHSEPDHSNSWYHSPYNTRLAISHVCQHWRFVALHAPLLWSRITFGSHETDLLPPPSSSSASAYLTRSASSPLTILLVFRYTFVLDHILKILSPHFGRVKEMRVVAYSVRQGDMDLIFGHEAPMLEKIDIRGLPPLQSSYSIPVSVIVHVSPFNDVATRLRTLRFRSMDIKFTSSSQPSLFRNLTKLELSPFSYNQRPTYPQFVSTLTASPVLETLVLRYACPFTYCGRWPQFSIPFPSLRRLCIIHDSVKEASSLVHRLHTPNLRIFQLTLEFDHHWFSRHKDVARAEEGDDLVRELTQPRHLGVETLGVFMEGVRTLVLHGQFTCKEESIARLYASAPNLRDVYLNMDRLPPYFFHTLYTNPECPPNLKTVAYRHVGAGSGLDPVKLVKRRKGVGFPLENLYLDPEEVKGLGKEDERYLREDDGVRCAFWTDKPRSFWEAGYESDEEA